MLKVGGAKYFITGVLKLFFRAGFVLVTIFKKYRLEPIIR
jgi:hypothetical protein